MRKKILLVSAINTERSIQQKFRPLAFCTLVAAIKEAFGKDIFEFQFVEDAVAEAMEKFRPDIVAITSVSQNYNIAKRYAKFAKAKNIPVLIGGAHITMLPLSLTDDMDVGVIGEGERTIVNVLNIYGQHGNFNAKEQLRDIHGIVFSHGGKLVVNAPDKPVKPIDILPKPDRSIFNMSSKNAYLYSSRGCPYRCEFCASSSFWKTARFHSAEYVVEEIEELLGNYPHLKVLGFYDDLFIAHRKRLRELSALIVKKGIHKRVSFTATASANLITREVAQLLKNMNVTSVSMGFESGNDRVLNYLKYGMASVEKNNNAIAVLKEYGISPTGSFIIGSIDETREEVLDTLRFIQKSGLTDFCVNPFTPLPGTPVWEKAKAMGIVSDDMDWDILDIDYALNHMESPHISQTLSRKELFELYTLFEDLRKKKERKLYIQSLISQGIRAPWKVPGFILKTIKGKTFT